MSFSILQYVKRPLDVTGVSWNSPNALAGPSKEITADEFHARVTQKLPIGMGYDQVFMGPDRINWLSEVVYFIYPDAVFAHVFKYKADNTYASLYFRIGCNHKFITEDLPHQMHRATCNICGFTSDYSSDG